MVCYFEPFGQYKKNSTTMIAHELKGRSSLPGIHYVKLPVVFGRAPAKALREIRAVSPDFVLCLGQNARARRLYIERVALNVNHTVFADNAGSRPFAEIINPGGAVGHWATMPYKKIMEVCAKNSISIKLSYFAGTYVCNNVLYMVLDAACREKLESKIGFIHVPAIKTRIKGKQSLECLSGAIEQIVRVLKYDSDIY